MVTTTEQTEGWKVRATIKGDTWKEVSDAIELYYKDYQYAGYGTNVSPMYKIDDKFVVEITRSRTA
jgi:hypothetical protein